MYFMNQCSADMSFAYNDATLVIKHNTMAYNKLSESGEKYAQNKHCLQTKTVQNSAEQMLVDFDKRGQQEMDFFMLLWITEYNFV